MKGTEMMTSKKKRKRNRPSVYPWTKWFTQGTFTLLRGKDYQVADYSMAQQIRNRAMRDPTILTVHIDIGEDRLDVSIVRCEVASDEG